MATARKGVGAPLPALDIDQEDVIQVVSDFALEIETGENQLEGDHAFGLGTFQDLTNPEDRERARAKGKNRTQHIRAGRLVVYDFYGNSREINETDVLAVIDPDIRADRRLYLRCPQCRTLPNHGIHTVASPNACPGRERLKWMPCPVCRVHGIETRIYELRLNNEAVEITEDEDMIAPRLPGIEDRESALQFRLNTHLAAFHPSEARSMYGIKKEEYFR